MKQLVVDGYHEDDRLDFKEMLHDPDPRHNDRILSAACAFANTRGGYLVFGVRDAGDGLDRIVGIPASQENAKHIHDKLKHAEPSLDFYV